MKNFESYFYFILAALLLHGCYSSRSSNHHDAAPDSSDVVIDDGSTNDTAPDVAPDIPPDVPPDVQPDMEPDAPPPAPYSLHEWGVISISEFGNMVHGPSPIGPEMLAEKPVIYLYSEEEVGPIDIGVNFRSGAATDVWPLIPTGPQVEWNDLTIFPGSCETTPFPYPFEDPLCEVCNLGSCVVEDADCIVFPDEDVIAVSKLLFYAGNVDDYRPALDASLGYPLCEDLPCISYNILNSSPYHIDDIWFIYRQTTSTCIDPFYACPLVSADIAFAHIDEMQRGEELDGMLFIDHYQAELDPNGFPISDLPLPQAWLDLGKDLFAKLVEKGMTEGEAAAFIRNWELAFFGLAGDDAYYIEPLYSNGAFLIYFMSREEYDVQFPLRAEPPPRETVRIGMIYQKLELFTDV